MIDEKIKTEHTWLCQDTPGYYICRCGATGIWNRDLSKIEVETPVPYEVMKRRHFIQPKVEGKI